MTITEIKAKIIEWITTGIPSNVKSFNLRALLTNMAYRMDILEPGRLKITKSQGNLALELEVGDNVYGYIENQLVHDAIYLGGNINLLASYLILDGTNGGAVSDYFEYIDINDMIANQTDQTIGDRCYVADATDDPNVNSGDAIYIYLGTTLGDLNDYRRLTDGEVASFTLQDIKRTVKGFVTTSSNHIDLISGINALPSYTVAPGELLSYQTAIIDPNDPLNVSIITLNTRNIGAGTYGVGETPLTGVDLYVVGVRRIAYGDAETIPSTQIINLGTHTSTDVTTVFNTHTFTGIEDPIQAKTTGLRLVNITLDGVDKQYFFTGAAGTYGTGGALTAVEADFDEISGDVAPPDYRLLYDRLIKNTSVTGTYDFDISLGETWRITMTGNTTFSNSNLPPTGFTKTITIHMDGNFAPTWPSGWNTEKSGSYNGTKLNTIVVEFVESGLIKVQISQKD